jgi:hypothetical protein
MAKKTPSSEINAKKAAILKELESVKALLNEDSSAKNNDKPNLGAIKYEYSKAAVQNQAPEEFQIPLLDPGKSTTFELDFSKIKHELKKQNTPLAVPVPKPTQHSVKSETSPDNIPTIDDITSSSSLFDDDQEEEEEESYQAKPSKITEKQLKDQAQLIIQELLNEAITELEDKLDHLIPNLEERLKKRLEKAMDEYISKALNK